MRTITLIVLHCSGTKTTQRYNFQQCKDDHLKRGYVDIGYHYLLRATARYMRDDRCGKRGRTARAITKTASASATRVASMRWDTRTKAQRQSMRALLERLVAQFPSAIILGHRDLSPDLDGDGHISPDEWTKQCPCFDALWDYENLEPAGLLNGND